MWLGGSSVDSLLFGLTAPLMVEFSMVSAVFEPFTLIEPPTVVPRSTTSPAPLALKAPVMVAPAAYREAPPVRVTEPLTTAPGFRHTVLPFAAMGPLVSVTVMSQDESG